MSLAKDSAILSCDKDGTIISVDDGFTKICGYQTTEILGKTVQDSILQAPYSTYFPTLLEKLSATNEFIGFNGTIEVVHKDGTIFPAHVSTALLGIANRSVVILQMSKWTDVECTLVFRMNGSIVSVRNAEEIFQFPDSEVKSLTLDSLLPSFSFPLSPEEAAPSISSLKQTIAREDSILGSRKDGSLIPLNIHLEEISAGGVTGFCRAKIRKIDLLKDILFVLDESWNIVDHNVNFTKELFELDSEDVKGRHITQFISGFGSSSTLSQRKRKRAEESALIQSSNFFKHGRGGYIPVMWTLIPLKSDHQSDPSTSHVPSSTPSSVPSSTPSQPSEIPESKQEVASSSHATSSTSSTYSSSSSVPSPSSSTPTLYAFLVRRLAQPAIAAPPSTVSSLSIQVNEAKAVPQPVPQPREISQKTQEFIGDYSMGEKIGEGTYGIVRRATHLPTMNDKIAVKILDKSTLVEADLKRSLREIDILKKLDHPNIVKVYEIIDLNDKIFIFMEQIRGGDLLRYCLHRSSGDLALDEDHVRRIFRELVSAVAYCHSMSIIHRDIKHTNILMDGEKVKLIDFGLGNFFASDTLLATFCGSPAYAAPELLLGTKYLGPEVDVWSLGIVLYSMLVGELPFTSVQATLRCDLKIPPKISADCGELLRTMLTVAPKRAHIDSVQNHRWLSGL